MTVIASASRRSRAAIAATGLALALLIIVAGNYHLTKGEHGGTGPALVTLIGCTILTAALFGFVLPRVNQPSRAALVLGILAVLSLAAFWSGATPVLAAASLAATTGAPATSGTARAAQVVGALAAAVAVAVTLAGSHLL